MHPKLIKANIARFKGGTSETQRLLREYVNEQPDAQESRQVQWLQANSEQHLEPKLKLLSQLAAKKSDDPYVLMAQQVLSVEERYKAPPKTATERLLWGVTLWKVAVFVVIGAAIAFLVFAGASLLTPPEVAEATPTPDTFAELTPTPLIRPTEIPLPLEPANYTVTYQQGVLKIDSFVL
ncbi:MAG: hypothetical protein ABI700_14145, partial [Chloroflexota bacterium]